MDSPNRHQFDVCGRPCHHVLCWKSAWCRSFFGHNCEASTGAPLNVHQSSGNLRDHRDFSARIGFVCAAQTVECMSLAETSICATRPTSTVHLSGSAGSWKVQYFVISVIDRKR